MKITESEILDALRTAAATGTNIEGASTSRELRRALGWGEKRMRDHLHNLKDRGQVTVVRVTREGLDGKPQLVTAYRLTPKTSPRRAA